MSILKTENLVKIYGEGPNKIKALDNVSIEVNDGEFVAIIGTSGSGKSTLLNMLGGLDTPTSGETIINGKKISSMKDEELTVFRRRNIGFIFQNYNLIDYMTPLENLKIVNPKVNKKILNNLGLADDEINRNVLQLSGGQQQRVAIARTLVTDSPVILADEPTGNLDSDTADEIIEILKTSAHKHGKCVIVVTHSKELAKKVDVVLVLKNKKLTQIN